MQKEIFVDGFGFDIGKKMVCLRFHDHFICFQMIFAKRNFDAEGRSISFNAVYKYFALMKVNELLCQG